MSTESYNAFTAVTAILNDYEASMINKFDVNVGEGFDLASKKDTTGQMFSSLLPMLLMVFMFTGCMAVAPESIAGEKERGTVATMLVTPMKRSELAIGKILSLGAIAILSGISSAAGTILAIPKLMGASGEEMNAAVYGVSDYAWLALIILSTVLVLISLISVVSAFAKTVKEATTMVTPLMILAMVVGISGMFTSAVKGAFYYYMIPLYNSVQSMIGIFTFSHNPVNIAVTVLSNLVYTCIFVFILTRMFNSERIVFSK